MNFRLKLLLLPLVLAIVVLTLLGFDMLKNEGRFVAANILQFHPDCGGACHAECR